MSIRWNQGSRSYTVPQMNSLGEEYSVLWIAQEGAVWEQLTKGDRFLFTAGIWGLGLLGFCWPSSPITHLLYKAPASFGNAYRQPWLSLGWLAQLWGKKKDKFPGTKCFLWMLFLFTVCFIFQEIKWSSELWGSIKIHFVSCGLKNDSMQFMICCFRSSALFNLNPTRETGRNISVTGFAIFTFPCQILDAFQTCSGR